MKAFKKRKKYLVSTTADNIRALENDLNLEVKVLGVFYKINKKETLNYFKLDGVSSHLVVLSFNTKKEALQYKSELSFELGILSVKSDKQILNSVIVSKNDAEILYPFNSGIYKRWINSE